MPGTGTTTAPAPVPAASVRSINGCWTCRLRRKKCDEARPCCRNCSLLQIDCIYGPKPVWMDRGVLERDAALRIKKQIASRCHRRTKSSSYSSPSTPAPASASSESRLSNDLPQAGDGTQRQNTDSGDNSLLAHHHVDSGWCTTDKMTTSGLDTISIIGTTVSLGSAVEGSPVDFALWCEEYGAEQDGILSPEVSLPLNPWQTLSSRNDLGDPPSQNPVLESIETAQTAPGHDKSVESPETYSTSHNSAMNPSAGSSSLTGSDFDRFPCVPTSQGMLTAEDALLLSYYMESVLPAQRIDNGAEQHSCMRFLLLTSAPVLQTTLTLAKAYRRLDIRDDNVADIEIADLLRDAANAVLRIPSVLVALSIGDQERQAEQIIVACTCLVQTIHLEVKIENPTGLRERPRTLIADMSNQIINATSLLWQECLQQAAAFAQPLIDLAAMNLGETADRRQATVSALHMYTAAAKALVGQLVWFDIVGAVSTGGRLQLAIDYDGLFASNKLPASGALGCRNDIVALFYQIICLRHWKLDLERGKKLNVMELATRGCHILQSLEDITTGINSPVLTATDEAAVADTINLVFTSTAVIYLHTVISGPILHLKEIRSETMKLGHLLHELAKTRHIGWVLLPVCMAACFWPQENVGELGNMIFPKQRDMPGVETRSKTCLLAALEMGRLALRDGGQGEWTLAGQHERAASNNRALLLG